MIFMTERNKKKKNIQSGRSPVQSDGPSDDGPSGGSPTDSLTVNPPTPADLLSPMNYEDGAGPSGVTSPRQRLNSRSMPGFLNALQELVPLNRRALEEPNLNEPNEELFSRPCVTTSQSAPSSLTYMYARENQTRTGGSNETTGQTQRIVESGQTRRNRYSRRDQDPSERQYRRPIYRPPMELMETEPLVDRRRRNEGLNAGSIISFVSKATLYSIIGITVTYLGYRYMKGE